MKKLYLIGFLILCGILPLRADLPKITHAMSIQYGEAKPDPYRYIVGAENLEIKPLCTAFISRSKNAELVSEAKDILALREKTDNWYMISYTNGFLGAFLILAGGIWWAANGPPWLFITGLVQHGSAHVTGYLVSEWSKESYQRADKLIERHNSAIPTAFAPNISVQYTYHY